MRGRTTTLLLCSTLIVAALGPVQLLLRAEAAGTTGHVVTRFGRLLQAVEDVPVHLIPTYEPPLCQGTDCCQADDYTSPFRLQHLNSSQTTVAGRTYTSFFLNLFKMGSCSTAIDRAGCCAANITSIWVDVDPELKVRLATLQGVQGVDADQSHYGFKMTIPDGGLPNGVPAGGMLVTITVEGAVKHLCPPPDIAPVNGLCDVIVEGTSPAPRSAACCPRGLTTDPTPGAVYEPPPFSCMADYSMSGFSLHLQSVSHAYTGHDGDRYSNYTLLLSSSKSCNDAGVNSCCDMQLSYIQLKVSKWVKIANVQYMGYDYLHYGTSPWNEPGENDYQALLIDRIDQFPSQMPALGVPITIIVKLEGTYEQVPNLCQPNAASSTQHGSCTFYLQSDSSLCCPSTSTRSVEIGNDYLSPPPPNVHVPPAPPPRKPSDDCDPRKQVSMSDTSLRFDYYEGPITTAPTATVETTTFVFLVSNTNIGLSKCNKKHCIDVCSWTLFVQPSVAGSVSVTADDPANSGMWAVDRSAQAAVHFLYGPEGASSTQYSVTVPGIVPLTALCRRNAFAGQGAKACAAQIKSGDVFGVAFFDQADVMVSSTAPSPLVCTATLPLGQSCVHVDQATFNSPDGSSSVFKFKVVNREKESGCAANQANGKMRFRVLLKAKYVKELRATEDAFPGNFNVVSSLDGIVWSSTPDDDGESISYSFKINGRGKQLEEICEQGVTADQPPNTCIVTFGGNPSCYSGFVVASHDPTLLWSVRSEGGSSKAAVVAPAVVVPLGMLVIAGAAYFFYARKKRQGSWNVGGTDRDNSSGSLSRPLNRASGSGNGRTSVSERDVNVRMGKR